MKKDTPHLTPARSTTAWPQWRTLCRQIFVIEQSPSESLVNDRTAAKSSFFDHCRVGAVKRILVATGFARDLPRRVGTVSPDFLRRNVLAGLFIEIGQKERHARSVGLPRLAADPYGPAEALHDAFCNPQS